MQAMSFGSGANESYAIDGAPYTIFDTGSSHLMVPPLLFEPMIDNIIAATGGADYAIQQGMAFVNCREQYKFQPIKFMFSEYYITVKPEQYIWDAYGDGSVCTLLLLANSYDFFLLGQPIYQGYYTVHNMTASTIAYVPLNQDGNPAL
jgi:hypothetical protein